MCDYMNAYYDELQIALKDLFIEEANWAFAEAFQEQN